MRKRFLGLFAVTLATTLLASCPNPTTPSDTVITLLVIPGVTAPVTGGTPVTNLDASQYTGTVSWSPTVTGTFAASTAYTATITLVAKSGYTLTGVVANSFTVAGATATNDANSGIVVAIFPKTLFHLSLISPTSSVFNHSPNLIFETDSLSVLPKIYINGIETNITNNSVLPITQSGLYTIRITASNETQTISHEKVIFVNLGNAIDNFNFFTNSASDLTTAGYQVPLDIEIAAGLLFTKLNSTDIYKDINAVQDKFIYFEITTNTLCPVQNSYLELGLNGDDGTSQIATNFQLFRGGDNDQYSLFIKEWDSISGWNSLATKHDISIEAYLPLKFSLFFHGSNIVVLVINSSNDILHNISTNSYSPIIGINNFNELRLKLRPVDSTTNNIGISTLKVFY